MVMPDHRGENISIMLMESMGLPAWIQTGTSRIYYLSIVTILLLLTATPLLVRHLRLYYKHAGKWVFAGCILLITVTPYLIQGVLMAVNFNRVGVGAMDFVQKDAKCTYKLLESRTVTNCNFTILNYGKTAAEVKVAPVFPGSGWLSDSVIESQAVTIRGHSRTSYSLTFTGTPVEDIASGTTNVVGLHLAYGGESKTIDYRE